MYLSAVAHQQKPLICPGAIFERSHIDYDDGSYREMLASRLRILALGYRRETICRAKPVNGSRGK
jgi:hypothetical protein